MMLMFVEYKKPPTNEIYSYLAPREHVPSVNSMVPPLCTIARLFESSLGIFVTPPCPSMILRIESECVEPVGVVCILHTPGPKRMK